jgi:hypothetical protein
MPKLIDKYNKMLRDEGLNARTRRARNWLKTEVANAVLPTNVRGASLLRDKQKQTTPSNLRPGKLYFYYYDPKYKDVLPYYDRFPLVLPIDLYKDGWLGLNFHYIRPNERLLLMDKLYETLTDDNFDEKTKLRANYGLLLGASRFGAFKPCVKRYLVNHVVSRIIEIDANDWEIALMLPVDSFYGAKRNEVYKNSKEMY